MKVLLSLVLLLSSFAANAVLLKRQPSANEQLEAITKVAEADKFNNDGVYSSDLYRAQHQNCDGSFNLYYFQPTTGKSYFSPNVNTPSDDIDDLNKIFGERDWYEESIGYLTSSHPCDGATDEARYLKTQMQLSTRKPLDWATFHDINIEFVKHNDAYEYHIVLILLCAPQGDDTFAIWIHGPDDKEIFTTSNDPQAVWQALNDGWGNKTKEEWKAQKGAQHRVPPTVCLDLGTKP